jgi:hypothetical protein
MAALLGNPLPLVSLSTPTALTANYSVGLRDQGAFPEIPYEVSGKKNGMDVSIVTAAEKDNEALRLLTLLGMPFSENIKLFFYAIDVFKKIRNGKGFICFGTLFFYANSFYISSGFCLVQILKIKPLTSMTNVSIKKANYPVVKEPYYFSFTCQSTMHHKSMFRLASCRVAGNESRHANATLRNFIIERVICEDS